MDATGDRGTVASPGQEDNCQLKANPNQQDDDGASGDAIRRNPAARDLARREFELCRQHGEPRPPPAAGWL
jgi:hypothetical protein